MTTPFIEVPSPPQRLYLALASANISCVYTMSSTGVQFAPFDPAHSAAIVRALLPTLSEAEKADVGGMAWPIMRETVDNLSRELSADKSAHEKTRRQAEAFAGDYRAASADRDSLRARVTELEKAKTGPDDASPDFNKETRRVLDECVGGDKGTVVGYGFEALYQLVRGLLEGKLKAEQRIVELEQQIKDSHDEHCKQLREWREAGDANRAAREKAEQRVGELEEYIDRVLERPQPAPEQKAEAPQAPLPNGMLTDPVIEQLQQQLAAAEERTVVLTMERDEARDQRDDAWQACKKARGLQLFAYESQVRAKCSRQRRELRRLNAAIRNAKQNQEWAYRNAEARLQMGMSVMKLEAVRERDEARAELERWRPVVEKAEKAADSHRPVVCHGTGGCAAISGTLEDLALIQAVDALRAGEKGGG